MGAKQAKEKELLLITPEAPAPAPAPVPAPAPLELPPVTQYAQVAQSVGSPRLNTLFRNFDVTRVEALWKEVEGTLQKAGISHTELLTLLTQFVQKPEEVPKELQELAPKLMTWLTEQHLLNKLPEGLRAQLKPRLHEFIVQKLKNKDNKDLMKQFANFLKSSDKEAAMRSLTSNVGVADVSSLLKSK